jgi:hypothetical protein
LFSPFAGGITVLRNVSGLQPEYMTLHTRNQLVSSLNNLSPYFLLSATGHASKDKQSLLSCLCCVLQICGVALLKAATFRSVLENSRQQPSYLYSFNYYGEHTKFGYEMEVDYPFPGGILNPSIQSDNHVYHLI